MINIQYHDSGKNMPVRLYGNLMPVAVRVLQLIIKNLLFTYNVEALQWREYGLLKKLLWIFCSSNRLYRKCFMNRFVQTDFKNG